MNTPAWTISVGGIDRKYKTVEINRKVRMDSPPEFTATIEYGSDVIFNNPVVIQRDGKTEWKGFIEDMEITWDKDGRYLNIGGRDSTLLLWRKYVENFANMIEGTGGFFGNVSASELIKFLLRTPRSDLPTDANGKTIYPSNKEGWGIDTSKFEDFEAENTVYGDIDLTTLRKRGLVWRNSGDPFAVATKVVDTVEYLNWEYNGVSPYVNIIDDNNWIHSSGVDQTAEFSFQSLIASSIYGCRLVIYYKPDSTYWTWINSDCWVYIWVESLQNWQYIGDFGGRAPPWNNPWRIIEFDVFQNLKTVADVNAAKVKFVEKSGSLGTFITYAALDIGYVGNGTQTENEWVHLSFKEEEIMGIYVESRSSAEMYPRNYKITCNGVDEPFSDYTEVDPNSHLSLSGNAQTLSFTNLTNNELAYFYKDYGAGGITNPESSTPTDFDETFSFEINSSQPTGIAYIVPWCLSTTVESYYDMINGAGHYFTAIEITDASGVLTLYCRKKEIGDGYGVQSSGYVIDHNVVYFVRVQRVDTTITYTFYNDSAMKVADIVFTAIFASDETIYRYRFQTLTYNGIEWADAFDNLMDHGSTGGEQIHNGDFELGSLEGWLDVDGSGYGHATISTYFPHTGTYCAKMGMYGNSGSHLVMDPTYYFDVLKADCSSATFWHKCPVGASFWLIMYYDLVGVDFTQYQIYGTGAWTQFDILSVWVDGKHLRRFNFDINSAEMYIDDVSLIVNSGWSRQDGTGGGTATRSTEITIKAPYVGNVASQKIHGTANNTGWYFEEDLVSSDEIKVDSWVRVPAPVSEGIDTDLECTTYDNWIDPPPPYTYGVIGTTPYCRYDSDMNNNHVFIAASIPTIASMKNEWSFEDPISKLAKTYGSFIPNSNSKVTIKARLQGTGVGYSAALQIKVYEYWQNAWITCGVSSAITDTSWQTVAEINGLDTYLKTLIDWRLAKIQINILSHSGDDNGGQVQIGYVRLHMEGIGYLGSINLMKLYNNAIAGGPNPSVDYVAGVAVVLDDDATTDQNKWRWKVDGFTGTGTRDSAHSTAVVENDAWYNIRLYAKRDSNGGYTGYFKLYDITSGSEVSRCEVTGLNNINYGPIDRYEFEVEYGTYNGSGQDAYLDWTHVQTKGVALSIGAVYSGSGPEITLVNVINNIYKDIIHSWTPRVITGLRIIITADDLDHGWEISQIYLYKTDPVKYRVVLDGLTQPEEKKLTFGGTYVSCIDSDKGLIVWAQHPPTIVPRVVGILVSYDNDTKEWRVNNVGCYYSPVSGDTVHIWLGTGDGTLSTDSIDGYAGGPYITIGAELDPSFEYSLPMEPMNISKNRLFDVLWDLSIAICDTNFMPYEWWVDYDTPNTFHIGSRRGYDKSATISFTTGANMSGVKYQKSSRDTYQRCEVIGQGEGSSQDKSSSFWTSDENAMDIVNGFIEDIVTQKQISNPTLANRYAKVKLKLDASPTGKNSIDCFISKDTYTSFDYTDPTATDTYNVGDDVTITDLFTGLNGSYRIWNLKTVIDNGGEVPTLTIQAPLLDIKNIWKEIWKELKNVGIVGGIAQDWAGQGTQSSKMAADKLTTLFDVTGKNEETDTQDKSSLKWWKTGDDSPPPTNGANWDAANGNLVIFGGTGGIGEIEVEARWEPVTGSPDGTVKIPVDIPVSQEPKFTGEFSIWEPDYIQSPSSWSNWLDNDLAEFGLFNTDSKNGFRFRIKKESGVFILYAVYTVNNVEIARKIRNLEPSTRDDTGYFHKYKVEIITNYSEPISSVIFNVYDETSNEISPTSTAFTKIQNISVRPIYVHAYGDGTSINTRCIMHFYNLKCERQVMP